GMTDVLNGENIFQTRNHNEPRYLLATVFLFSGLIQMPVFDVIINHRSGQAFVTWMIGLVDLVDVKKYLVQIQVNVWQIRPFWIRFCHNVFPTSLSSIYNSL